MFKLTWKFNGRTIPPNRLAKELTSAMRSEAYGLVEKSISRIRCPVHGETPHTIRRVPQGGSRVNFEYQACCEALTAAVEQHLR